MANSWLKHKVKSGCKNNVPVRYTLQYRKCPSLFVLFAATSFIPPSIPTVKTIIAAEEQQEEEEVEDKDDSRGELSSKDSRPAACRCLRQEEKTWPHFQGSVCASSKLLRLCYQVSFEFSLLVLSG